jgi:hypothetical protein
VQQHVGDAQHVRELLLFDRSQGGLHSLLVVDLANIVVAHVAHCAGEEAAGAAGGIKQNLAGPRVDPVGHEGGHGAWRIIFAGVSGALQVVKNLLVDVAEMWRSARSLKSTS